MVGITGARPGLGRALLSISGALEITPRRVHRKVLITCPALLKEVSRERHVFLKGQMLAGREPRGGKGLADYRIAHCGQPYTNCCRDLFAAQGIS